MPPEPSMTRVRPALSAFSSACREYSPKVMNKAETEYSNDAVETQAGPPWKCKPGVHTRLSALLLSSHLACHAVNSPAKPLAARCACAHSRSGRRGSGPSARRSRRHPSCSAGSAPCRAAPVLASSLLPDLCPDQLLHHAPGDVSVAAEALPQSDTVMFGLGCSLSRLTPACL